MIKKYFFIFSLIFSSVLLATSGDTEQISEKADIYTLSYKFPPGEEIYYQMNFNKKDEFLLAGQKAKRENKTLLYTSHLFEGIDTEGNGLFKISYLQGWQDGQRVFPQEKEVSMKMSPSGEILESQGLEQVAAEFLKIIMRGLADYIPGFDRLPIKIDLTKFPSNSFNSIWQSFVLPLPDTPVLIGDSWIKKDKQAGEMLYRLQQVENEKAFIEISRTKTGDLIAGNAIFDIQKGHLISVKIKAVTESSGKIIHRIAKEIDTPVKTEQLNIPDKTSMEIQITLLETE